MEQNNIKLVSIICPECYGVLQVASNKFYKCSMGHEHTLLELIAKHNKKIDEFLWTVDRLIDERTTLIMLLAQQEPALSNLFAHQAISASPAAAITGQLV